VEMQTKLNLPRVRRVSFERFSLFKLMPSIDIPIPEGIFCLAGANGLGKTTFLAAVGYGITGITPNPRISFRSAEEYYEDCLDYAKEFFDGRISEDDRDVSSITVELQIKNQVFEITRGMFEPNELRVFTVRRLDNGDTIFNGEDISPRERQDAYERKLLDAIGLSNFKQYVFLHHFVLNFDERRELLLWNQTTLLNAIFLAIGIDSAKAQQADWIRSDRDNHASYGRNYRWQSTLLGKEIGGIRKKLNVAEAEESYRGLREKYQDLLKNRLRLENEMNAKRNGLKDAELERMEYSSELTSLQTRFSEIFAQKFHSRHTIALHPVVKNSIANSICEICGSIGADVATNIEDKLKVGICPLCGKKVNENLGKDDEVEELKEVDLKIADVKKRLDTTNKTRKRLTAKLSSVEEELNTINEEISNLETENSEHLSATVDAGEDLSGLIEEKTKEMLNLQKKSEEEYRLRDTKQSELITLYDELRQRYIEAQVQFVPLFRELSKLFIGMDMDIRMEYSTALESTGLQLIIEMQGIARRETHQLSESQKFFLDIALRMALAQYMSDPEAKACLFIDTPEGSLDIAYESRAGEMFARFAENGHDILMTANINSSQFLKKMAMRCGKSNMTLHRMTSWTELSTVQQQEEHLFNEAYEDIEKLLEGADSNA